MGLTQAVRSLVDALGQLSEYRLYGRAAGVLGMTIGAWLGRVINALGEPIGR